MRLAIIALLCHIPDCRNGDSDRQLRPASNRPHVCRGMATV